MPPRPLTTARPLRILSCLLFFCHPLTLRPAPSQAAVVDSLPVQVLNVEETASLTTADLLLVNPDEVRSTHTLGLLAISTQTGESPAIFRIAVSYGAMSVSPRIVGVYPYQSNCFSILSRFPHRSMGLLRHCPGNPEPFLDIRADTIVLSPSHTHYAAVYSTALSNTAVVVNGVAVFPTIIPRIRVSGDNFPELADTGVSVLEHLADEGIPHRFVLTEPPAWHDDTTLNLRVRWLAERTEQLAPLELPPVAEDEPILREEQVRISGLGQSPENIVTSVEAIPTEQR